MQSRVPISIGFGGVFGFGVLFDLPESVSLLGTPQINVIEAMLVLWSIAASVFLLQGKTSVPALNND